jgi:hypothetical protein
MYFNIFIILVIWLIWKKKIREWLKGNKLFPFNHFLIFLSFSKKNLLLAFQRSSEACSGSLSGFKAQKPDEPDGQTPGNIGVNRTSESSIIEAQNEPLVRNNLHKNNTIISATGAFWL